MIETICQGLKQDGFEVSISKLCRWFEVPRRTVYCKPTKAPAKVQERFVKPITEMIEQNPSFGCRTVAHLLEYNKNTVQRIFQLKGWQIRKRPVGMRPRGLKTCRRWLKNRTNAGRPICVASGADVMAGRLWLW
jgi:putative transposase